MRLLLACLILGASLTACSSTPPELPTCEIPGPSPVVGMPLSIPQMPVETSRSESSATFDLQGVLQMERVREALETNTKVARENALALEARNEEVEQLIECARYSKQWMQIKEEMLEQEQRDHFIDTVWHRGLLVLGAVAALL